MVLQNTTTSCHKLSPVKRIEQVSFHEMDGEQVVTECYLGGLYLLSKTTIYILTGRIIRYSSIEVL